MKQRFLEISINCFAWFSGLLLIASVFLIIAFLFINGWGSLNLSLIFGDVPPADALLFRRQVFSGLFPAIVGTISLVILAVGMATPVGIATGIYLAEYGKENTKTFLSIFYDILAGIPSIVIGLFGFSLSILLHRYINEFYPCLLISAMSLAILVLPYLIRTTQFAMENIEEDVRLTAPALGANTLQNILYVLLPRSLSGIASGVILAIGRCAEDTAVIMLTGVVATAGIPKSLMKSYEALPFYIYYISSQYINSDELQTGYGAAIILLLICAGLFLIAFFIKNIMIEKMLYRS
ncbi:MAG: ABC transporter permease subunit [Proteobacteria bacterium]|nr:ABC transporter permease subunit [Pseudomonadota bacterium]